MKKRYGNAKTTLNFSNDYEALVSIVLSAQSTDISVNKVTPALFKKYPDTKSLKKAKLSDLESIIKSLGLYHNKTKSLQKLALCIENDYFGTIPSDRETLQKLPGVGEKVAGVYLLEILIIPSIPVDTHVGRVSARLGYTEVNDSPKMKEKKLEKAFPKEDWIFIHHALIYFGRDICQAKNPKCFECPLKDICHHFKKCSSIIGKKS